MRVNISISMYLDPRVAMRPISVTSFGLRNRETSSDDKYPTFLVLYQLCQLSSKPLEEKQQRNEFRRQVPYFPGTLPVMPAVV